MSNDIAASVTDAKFSIIEKSENIVPVLKKINEMHLDVLKADWEKDKMYAAGANRPAYMYLSSDKLKQNISPILANHGVVFLPLVDNLTIRPPVGNMTTHFTLEYGGMIADAETGSYIVGKVIGEAADSGDKTLGKATTSGNKLFWFNVFQIADGIDPEAAPSERISLAEEKKTVAKTAGIPAPAKAPATAPKTAAPPKAVPPKAVPSAAVPKAAPTAAPQTVQAQEEVAVTPSPSPAEKYVPKMAIGNAIARIIEAHPELEAEANAISSDAEAKDFIANH